MTGEFARNLRFGLRTFRRSPAFTFGAVTTLALCLGANTAIFSVVDAVLFRPLPYPDPHRLAEVVTEIRGEGGQGTEDSQDGAAWVLLRQARSFDLAAMSGGFTGVNLVSGGAARYVQHSRCSAGYFRTLGIVPAMGREFTADEDRAGGPPSAILGYSLWRSAFQGDPSVVGRSILLRGEPHTVVGVLPEHFRSMSPADLWTPLRPSITGEGGGTNYMFIARLRDGATWAEADGEAESLGASAIPGRDYGPKTTARIRLVPLQQGQSAGVRRPLYVMWGAAAMVLLIGCVNVAGLMLARGAARRREIGTRIALGGGAGALMRQMLTESVVIAVLGAIAGLAVAYVALAGLTIAAKQFDLWQEFRLDWRVMAAAAAMALVTSVLFGVAPALQSMRVDIRGALSDAGGRGVTGGRAHWLRRSLIAAEVALSLVLLVGAGLLVRTLIHLRQLEPGFDSKGLLTATVSMQDARYRTAERISWFFSQTLQRLRATPGIDGAAVALHVPYQRWLNWGATIADGAGAGEGVTTSLNYVTPGYFDVLKDRVLAGRAIDDRDTSDSARMAMVNRAFAERYLRDPNPVGRHIKLGGSKVLEIVGVADDLQQKPSFGQFEPLGPVPAVFVPVSQFAGFEVIHAWFGPSWIVRSSSPQDKIAAAVRSAIESVDPMLPVSEFHTFEGIMGSALSSQRLGAGLLGTLAALALVLAAVGIYGLISNMVVERRREIGVRLALGGTRAQVIGETARSGVVLALVGLGIGIAISAAAVRVLQAALYGVRPLDPMTFISAAIVLMAVAAAASLVPALRIARLDPASTLRDE